MKNTINALEFGTSKIVALIAETAPNMRCDIIGAGSEYYDGFLSGHWNAPDTLNDSIRNAIAEAENQSKTRVREINIGVPAEFCTVYTVEAKVELQGVDPKVTGKDIDALMNHATESIGEIRGNIIHRSPAWFIVDDGKKTLEPVDQRGSELRGMISFIVADNFFLEDVTNRLTALGYNVTGYFAAPIGEAMLFIPDEERDRTAVLVDVGYLSTDVMTVEGDALTSLKVIPTGGGNIAADLAYGLNISLNAAEQIKRQYVFGLKNVHNSFDITDSDGNTQSFAHDKVEKIMEPSANALCEEIKKAIDESGVKLSNWSPVYLTGGGLCINRGGRDFLSTRIGKPVKELPRKAVKLCSPVYSTALGLLDLIIDIVTSARNNSGVSGFFRNLFGS